MISMLFHRFWLRSLLALGLVVLLGAPSFAQVVQPDSGVILQGKRGGDPPRPKPKPGPREGGDGD